MMARNQEIDPGPQCPGDQGECSSVEVWERHSLGIYAGRWCDKHWETSGYRKEGASSFDPADCGETYGDGDDW